jgi:type I restriction enzyme, S subunit
MIKQELWSNKQLGDILELIRNGYSGKQVNYNTNFPVSRIETISDGKIDLSKVGFVENIPKSYLLKEGDMLFSNINSLKHIGKIAYVKEGMKLYHGMNLLIFRVSQGIHSKFLYYKLVQSKNWFEKMAAQAVNQASINQEEIKKCPIIIPNLFEEQSKIAEILETVDLAIEKTEALILKQERIKTGLMQNLLTKGIDDNGIIRSEETHEFKDSPIGRIPVEWEYNSVNELLENNILLDVQDGNHGGQHPKSKDYVDEGVPFIMAADISSGFIDKQNCKKITNEQFNSLRIGFSKPGDILLSHKASIGFVAFVEEEDGEVMLTPQVTYYRIADINSLFHKYLKHFFTSDRFQITLNNLAKQSTRDYVGITAQKQLIITYPLCIFEQKRISEILDQMDKTIIQSKESRNKLFDLKIGLMQDLLTGGKRVTGLLDDLEGVS